MRSSQDTQAGRGAGGEKVVTMSRSEREFGGAVQAMKTIQSK